MKKFRKSDVWLLSAMSLLLLLTVACGRDEIKVYRVPKEAPPSVVMPARQDTTAPVKWRTPDGWQELQPGEMRVASFKVSGADGKQADISVIPLPGVAGSDFSNVNRWRGQVGLPPVSEEEVKQSAQDVMVAGQPAQLYEMAGETMRILAVIQRREGMAWFFKMTGDSQLVAQQKPVFVGFLKSFQLGGGEVLSGPKWEVPVGWKEAPAGQFLVAKFIVTGAGTAQAVVNVSASAGDGGGVAANVNRWRKQLGLSELSGDELTKAVRTEGDLLVVEIQGQTAVLVGAIVRQPGKAWFYKLMGDPTIVAAQKEVFIKFVQGVRY